MQIHEAIVLFVGEQPNKRRINLHYQPSGLEQGLWHIHTCGDVQPDAAKTGPSMVAHIAAEYGLTIEQGEALRQAMMSAEMRAD